MSQLPFVFDSLTHIKSLSQLRVCVRCSVLCSFVRLCFHTESSARKNSGEKRVTRWRAEEMLYLVWQKVSSSNMVVVIYAANTLHNSSITVDKVLYEAPGVCVRSLRVPWLPPTVQRRPLRLVSLSCKWMWVWMFVCLCTSALWYTGMVEPWPSASDSWDGLQHHWWVVSSG